MEPCSGDANCHLDAGRILIDPGSARQHVSPFPIMKSNRNSVASSWALVAVVSCALLAPVRSEESILLDGIRQLTFEGKRAGEGYFSADGTKMVFQSEREEGNPFYQIYLLDLETGDTTRISPGFGKTTCAWIHPDGKRVLFASTHEDADAKKKQEEEIAIREAGTARKYSWDYDEHYEIYEYDLETGEYTNLTGTRGYDAEGAYSPDGEWIVFASNRQAYDGSLSEKDRKAFRLDKKFPMELYLARADGSDVRRLTDTDGYDGGPFFSADGKKICWRRFNRKGTTAEIFTMNVDGTDERQLTRLGAMSWAPYFHPSGDYLIFATNKHGFGNFELYLVDAAGEKEPVRVTHTDGFDGLPVFSPDGTQLSWTSNRTASEQSQIFLAAWDHEKARQLLGLDAGETSVTETNSSPVPDVPDFETVPEITVDDMRRHIEYLASDELEGRLTGTRGEQLATQYVANQFAELGLLPGGDDDTFFEEFAFTAGVAVGKDNKLSIEVDGQEIEPTVDEDWRPVSFSENKQVKKGGVVFAGFGMELPESEEGDAYSSYFHLDVKGKWVMVLRYFPEDAPKELRERLQRFSRLRHKATVARRKFARGIIFVTGPETEVNEELVPMRFDASLADSGVPALSITREMAEKMFAGSGRSLAEVHAKLNKGEMVQGFDLSGVGVAATLDVDQEKKVGRNVLGILSSGEDQGPHPAPAVLIGAHVDHLGPNAGTGSLAKDDEKDEIHYGADDNASGTAALLEIAEYLADQAANTTSRSSFSFPESRWSGEELGLLGSSHFVRNLAKNVMGDENAPLNFLLSSYLNMDMIGRLDDKLVLQGLGSSEYWAGAVERGNVAVGLPITTQRDTYLPTDATPFYLRKVPILSAFTGAHPDYHTPRDTVDKINYEGAQKVARLMGLITRGLAKDSQVPQYVKVAPPKNRGARGFRVYLGTIPDYSQGDAEGVKLSGVAEGGPAAKAGVKGGDAIIGLDGKEILNIYDYTEILGGLKVGEETSIRVARDGEKLDLRIVPDSRD